MWVPDTSTAGAGYYKYKWWWVILYDTFHRDCIAEHSWTRWIGYDSMYLMAVIRSWWSDGWSWSSFNRALIKVLMYETLLKTFVGLAGTSCGIFKIVLSLKESVALYLKNKKIKFVGTNISKEKPIVTKQEGVCWKEKKNLGTWNE